MKEILFLSNKIQQLKEKHSIELCLCLWSLGKKDLGFDSLKMRNLPCALRSEIGGVFLFFLLFSLLSPATDCQGIDKGLPSLVPGLLGGWVHNSGAARACSPSPRSPPRVMGSTLITRQGGAIHILAQEGAMPCLTDKSCLPSRWTPKA